MSKSYSKCTRENSHYCPLANTKLREIARNIATEYNNTGLIYGYTILLNKKLLYSFIYNAALPFITFKYAEFYKWENKGLFEKYADDIWKTFGDLFLQTNFLSKIRASSTNTSARRDYYKLFEEILIQGADILYTEFMRIKPVSSPPVVVSHEHKSASQQTSSVKSHSSSPKKSSPKSKRATSYKTQQLTSVTPAKKSSSQGNRLTNVSVAATTTTASKRVNEQVRNKSPRKPQGSGGGSTYPTAVRNSTNKKQPSLSKSKAVNDTGYLRWMMNLIRGPTTPVQSPKTKSSTTLQRGQSISPEKNELQATMKGNKSKKLTKNEHKRRKYNKRK